MKLFIVKAESDSTWLSCKTISKNLRKAYEALPSEYQIRFFSFNSQLTPESAEEFEESLSSLAKAIREERPDRLVFIDHFPLPPQFLQQLLIYLKSREIPQILIHVYGDFTYFSKEWVKFFKVSAELKILFAVASDAQKRLLSGFLPNKAPEIVRCFFPLDSEDYFYDEKTREEERAFHQIDSNEKVFIYTGRISLQKNVEALLKEFISLAKKHPETKSRLWIVGNFDDSGAEVFGVKTYHGYLFSKFESLLSRLPQDVRSRIVFFGHRSKSEVRKLLCASDVFCSLSLFHDDDYGMSPAEALACGVPCILTAWGGYSSFLSYHSEWDCKLLGVSFSHLGHDIEMKYFRDSYPEPVQHQGREAKAQNFMKAFSIPSATKVIEHLLQTETEPFGEIGFKLYHYSTLSKVTNKAGLTEYFMPGMDGLYEDIYKHYISLSADKKP